MKEKKIIDQFLAQKHLAVAGVSRDAYKFGTIVFKHLQDSGYQVYPINPGMDEFMGKKCYHTIAELPEEVSALVTVTKPEVTVNLIVDAAKKGIGLVWMQQGSESPEAIIAADKANVAVVKDRCIMMPPEPVE